MKITKRNIPNLISGSRVLLILVVILLMYPFGLNVLYIHNNAGVNYTITLRQILAGVVFIFAICTDYIDGYLARKWNVVSDFGKFFDSIADKLLCNAVIIIFISVKAIPIWLGLLLILRDFYLDLLRQLMAHKSIVVASNWWGKWTTAIKMTGLALLFYVGPWQFSHLGIYHWINQIILIPMYISLILSLTAACIYTQKAWPHLRGIHPVPKKQK